MAVKFGLNYEILIDANDGSTISIKPPFTFDFDISRDSYSSASTGSFRIINLGEHTRNQIRKDQWDYNNLKSIIVKAGYGKNLSVIFAGNVYKAWSVHDSGSTEWLTQLECFDGGFAFANAQINIQYPAGTSQQTVIGSLINSLKEYGVNPGAVGEYSGNIGRMNSYSGSTTDVLREITGGGFFIDNNQANCLNDDECLAAQVKLIDDSTGLLGVPLRETNYVNFQMLFEPQLAIGERIKLVSDLDKSFNTHYIIKSLKHRGVISGAITGQTVTSVGALPGTFFPVQVVR